MTNNNNKKQKQKQNTKQKLRGIVAEITKQKLKM